MHLILTGGTGVVGSAVLAHVISLPPGEVTRLTILSRRPVPLADGYANCKVIPHHDFSHYPPELLADLRGAQGVVWALGVSQNDVSKEDYIKITKGYPLAAAEAFSTLSDKVTFVYVSGEGADTKGRHPFGPLFGRVKGEAEMALLELGKRIPSLRIYNLRPGYVDGALHPEVWQRVAPRRTSTDLKFMDSLAPLLRTFRPSMISPPKELGRILTELAMGSGKPLDGSGILGEGRTISNQAFRRLAGL